MLAEVVDRGKGFNLDDKPRGSGLGFYGMRERAELVNGNINIESHLNKRNHSHTRHTYLK